MKPRLQRNDRFALNPFMTDNRLVIYLIWFSFLIGIGAGIYSFIDVLAPATTGKVRIAIILCGVTVLGVVIWPSPARRHPKDEKDLWKERVSNGLCPYCGFDVRSCTDRCSECGRMIPSAVDRVLQRRKES